MSPIFHKNWYPLTPNQAKKYVKPPTVYLDVQAKDDNFIIAHIGTDEFQTRAIEDVSGLTDWIVSQDNKTWILTYNLDWFPVVLLRLLEKRFKVSGFAAETNIITLKSRAKEIYLIDIFQFFGETLSDIYKKLGYFSDGLSWDVRETDLRSYSQASIIALIVVWDFFRDQLKTVFNVHPSKTPGSTALKIWRTTLKGILTARGKPIRKFAAQACLPPALHWSIGFYPHVYLYDLNASYLAAMRSIRFPVSLTGFAGEEPPSNRWIATVKLNYDCDFQFSPLPIRTKTGEILHPTKARNTTATITYIDYVTLASHGKLEILEWIEGVYWLPEEEIDLFSEWAQTVENQILEKPETKPIWKIITRALHSKFAQKAGFPLAEIRVINPDLVEKWASRIFELYPLENGDLAAKIVTTKKPRFQAYLLPHIEALTLAAGRLMIYGQMDENTIYIDTDCLISTVPRPDLSLGSHFGQWKLSSEGPCSIAGPRLYTIDRKAKTAGLKAFDKRKASQAIETAVSPHKGIIEEVEAIEKPPPLSGSMEITYRPHTIRLSKYPKVETDGLTAFVTRSPTVKTPIKPIRKILT